MGMTDRQFDSHLRGLLRDLKRIKMQLENEAGGIRNEELEELIKDIEEQLQRP